MDEGFASNEPIVAGGGASMVTVTVVMAVALSAAPAAVKVYVVVALGVTVWALAAHETAPTPLSIVQVVVLATVQESVADWPAVIAEGLATNPVMTGTGGSTVKMTAPLVPFGVSTVTLYGPTVAAASMMNSTSIVVVPVWTWLAQAMPPVSPMMQMLSSTLFRKKPVPVSVTVTVVPAIPTSGLILLSVGAATSAVAVVVESVATGGAVN
jgi:hypothetical protein